VFKDSRGKASNEPNNMMGSEFCVVANFTETNGGAWNWADTLCSGEEWPFMCMVTREPAHTAAACQLT
jgi:hypothetical protein